MPVIPALVVRFDDGTEIEVQPKSRDMALAERDYHHDYTKAGQFRSAYATALAVLHRMKRTGDLNGMVLPETVDALMDVADIDVLEDDDPKDSDPAPSTG